VFLLGGILHRMIFWELLRVFALTLTGLTGLFLIGLVIQQASQLGLSIGQTLAIIPLLIPYTLPYTIPTTTLFASCVVYGRISHDNEAVAMKAAGVNLHSILRPAALLGVLMSLVTFGLAYTVIPNSNATLQTQILKDPEEVLYSLLKRERTFRANNFPYVIHVKDVQGRRLIDVIFKRKKMEKDNAGKDIWLGVYDYVIRAREARLRVVMPTPDKPNEPTMLFIDPDRWVGADGTMSIETGSSRPVGVPLPDVFSPKDVNDRPMNLQWDELPPKAHEFELEYLKAVSQQIATAKIIATTTDLVLKDRNEKHAVGLKYLAEHWMRQIRNTQNEYYMRPALALSCLVFALIGCPVGIWANRADYLSSFVICFLPTVFAYYPILLAGSNMARDGKVPMPVGIFAADAIVAVLAGLLTIRLVKR